MNPEEETKNHYDMNMRNYMTSTDLPVKSIKQLRQNTEQGSTLEVVFDLQNTGLKYNTAANLAIYPRNREADVERFAKLFGINLKKQFRWTLNKEFKGKQPNTPFPVSAAGISVKEALTVFVDLQG